MRANIVFGLLISIINLFFYALGLDLLFDAGIYNRLFQLDIEKLMGSNALFVGIAAIVIAIVLEYVSYRVVRRGMPR